MRGSLLFFSILSLHHLDPVYTFSSQWFLKVFIQCIQAIAPPTGHAPSFQLYVDELVEYLTITVFQKVSCGILMKHFLPFIFKLCAMLIVHKDPSLKSRTSITHQEWMFLLKDTPQVEKTKISKPDEISPEAWESATMLAKFLPAFQRLLVHIVNNVGMWVEFSRSAVPWKYVYKGEEVVKAAEAKRSSIEPFRLAYVNRFQKLLLVNAFCPGQLAAGVRWFVGSEMGVVYTTKASCSLQSVYRSMTNVKPVLFIITPSKCQ